METLSVVLNALPYILRGSLVTLLTVGGALSLGLAAGVPLAVFQVYGPAWARALIAAYVWFFRGVPVLLCFFFSISACLKRLG